MSKVISAKEVELLSFFEVEPKKTDADIPWPYNHFLYEVTRGDLCMSCAIEPASKDVRITLKRSGETLYELRATNVEDVRYHNDNSREALEIALTDREKLWVTVKPKITIAQEVAG